MNAITPSAIRILHGDCRDVLRTLPDRSVQCCVTSPPYYGLRDYCVDGQIGLESSPQEYVDQMVAVFGSVRRVLRDDGTLWLNLGDSTRNKQLLGVPWRVAFALQSDGWWLRSAIVWAKPNPMPESVTDRPTSSYEMVFLMAKSERYSYDAVAVAEDATQPNGEPKLTGQHKSTAGGFTTNGTGKSSLGSNQGFSTRNCRNVWTIATQPYSGAHFATMPPDLAERCIKAGSKPGDTVLDPFGGAGTTGLVADRLGRRAVLIELNPEYAGLATGRIVGDCPLFASVT